MQTIDIEIKSALKTNVDQKEPNEFQSALEPTLKTENCLFYEMPFGRILFCRLNVGLTIVLMELNYDTPGILCKFKNIDSDICYKIDFCLKGSYYINYSEIDLNILVKSGENLITTIGKSFCLSTPLKTPVKSLNIIMPKKFFENYFKCDSFFNNREVKDILYGKDLIKREINTGWMTLALDEIFRADPSCPFSKITLESKILEILSLFFKQYREPLDVVTRREKERLCIAHDYITNNLSDNISISKISRHLGTNENCLQLNFKKFYGITVKKYICKLKMEKARQLILEEDFSVSEAGYEVGYTNLSYFTRAFKKEFGILPSELKKSTV